MVVVEVDVHSFVIVNDFVVVDVVLVATVVVLFTVFTDEESVWHEPQDLGHNSATIPRLHYIGTQYTG